ncbi:uncharacterized protein EV420DRAFT_1538415 [Desarmillaria tabescens]|uniref:Uncharacterized protein n=1 Tax=Armillaria tabescens TaxID=1929756 RepID=A0AA39N6D9_ARMTA|nr:uncharacterized protein EV420DRAFT_1538415 [Desarmillaria tabescens]KAK0459123.1 hypothetical protein EV420DRAFT_1538415 [Desarmillaria tabescens]
MGVANIPLDKAYLTAIWLETLFYGINIFLFFSYLWIARYWQKPGAVNLVVLFTAIAMFCFSTVHVSLGFYRLVEGFIYRRDLPGGPGGFFSDVSIPANVAKVCIHTINSILGDSIVVWRCYHVWGRDWVVCILPILLIIASAVCGFGQTVIFAEAKMTHSAFGPNLQRWNGSLFSLSLVTNVVATSLIAFRIWHLGRQFTFSSSFRYRRVLTLVVESGAIYSSALIIEITLYFLNTNAFYIIYDPIAQLTAIVPTMIIVMTSLGLTSNDLNEQTKLSVETSPHFALKPNRGGTETGTDSAFVAAPRSVVLGTNSASAESGFERSLYLDVKRDDPVLYSGGSGSDRILDSV